MTAERLKYILMWLLAIATSIFLIDRMFTVVSALASPLIMFAMAWLVVLALKPLAESLARVELPMPVLRFDPRARRLAFTTPMTPLPYKAAVALVYLGILAILIGVIFLFFPIIMTQLSAMQETMPNAGDQTLKYMQDGQAYLNQFGLHVDITKIIQPETIMAQFASLGSEALKQSLNIASSVANVMLNLIFVLILSFYMMIDGSRLIQSGMRLLPADWRGEVATFLHIVDRTFGGYLRSQLLQSLLYGIGTSVIMMAFGFQDIALASLIAGLCVIIPIFGGPLALIPPVIVALINAPDRTIWLIIALLALQQVVFNMIMPRLVGQIVGLSPLLVFAAMLVGGTVAGAWGLLFGIPIAGVLASVTQFIFDRKGFEVAQAAQREEPPTLVIEPIADPPTVPQK